MATGGRRGDRRHHAPGEGWGPRGTLSEWAGPAGRGGASRGARGGAAEGAGGVLPIQPVRAAAGGGRPRRGVLDARWPSPSGTARSERSEAGGRGSERASERAGGRPALELRGREAPRTGEAPAGARQRLASPKGAAARVPGDRGATGRDDPGQAPGREGAGPSSAAAGPPPTSTGAAVGRGTCASRCARACAPGVPAGRAGAAPLDGRRWGSSGARRPLLSPPASPAATGSPGPCRRRWGRSGCGPGTMNSGGANITYASRKRRKPVQKT